MAILSAAVGYMVMSFIMTATPVSMHVMDGHSLGHTKWVIQSHIIAMYLPSIFTAWIVRKLGVPRMMIGGLIAFASSLSNGSDLSALHLVGLGLAGSGVGALAVGILGAFTGTNVHKVHPDQAANIQYVLVADITPTELKKAQILLQESGIPVTPN
ncbi:MAG: hypothetical protein HC781_23360 [Leptolyngbyaceae cyanobacterium CSU_1_4]|nr:hypothetical protein [Leptolyngbyaceae cyanobacterium CSU_1_4]